MCGALPVVAYLLEWLPPVWIALGLSALALASPRLAVLAFALGRRRHVFGHEDSGPHAGLYRLDEGLRVVLLGGGLAVLGAGEAFGWLPILAAAASSILEGSTAFSFTLLVYALGRWIARRVRQRGDGTAPRTAETHEGNPNCVVCRVLECAPYGRCRWCRLSSIRWCCGLQTSMLLVLMLVIAFLLNAALEPVVTKLLVTTSIVGVVALSLTITRQTNDLIGTLNSLERVRARVERRCEFLKRLTLADSVQAAADAAIEHLARTVGVRRVSVMLAEDGHLRIAASQGIPAEVAETVSVPVPSRICGRVFASGVPLVLNNVTAEGMFETLGLNAGAAMASFPLVTAPMQTAGRKIGVINVTDRPGGPFGEDDLEELQATAEAAAISLSSQVDHRNLVQANLATIRSLANAIEAKDPYTHGHSMRVQAWATAVAKALGISGNRLRALSFAAELHDIGKIAVPDDVLRAPRRLTEQEWALVQEHPRRGLEMVRHLVFLESARTAILHHHERLDGAGYPDGLTGSAIPLEARILGVVDAYDAMTSARPYRPPLSHEQAATELRRCSGTQFDPACVDAFLRLLGSEASLDLMAAATADARAAVTA